MTSTIKVDQIQNAAGTNTLNLGSGNSSIAGSLDLSNGGVYLGGTGSANLLDDYEEGAWTPYFGSGTITYPSSGLTYTGRYTKVGNILHLSAYINGSTGWSWSGISDYLTLSGLPFSVVSGKGGGVVTTGNVAASGTKGVAYGTDGPNLFIYGFEATHQPSLYGIVIQGTFEVS